MHFSDCRYPLISNANEVTLSCTNKLGLDRFHKLSLEDTQMFTVRTMLKLFGNQPALLFFSKDTICNLGLNFFGEMLRDIRDWTVIMTAAWITFRRITYAWVKRLRY